MLTEQWFSFSVTLFHVVNLTDKTNYTLYNEAKLSVPDTSLWACFFFCNNKNLTKSQLKKWFVLASLWYQVDIYIILLQAYLAKLTSFRKFKRSRVEEEKVELERGLEFARMKKVELDRGQELPNHEHF